MNPQLIVVSNTWTAFVFGAVFNWLAALPDENLIVYAVKTLIGGGIWLLFQVLANRIKNSNTTEKKKDEHDNNEKKAP
jgi:hypothetical protein